MSVEKCWLCTIEDVEVEEDSPRAAHYCQDCIGMITCHHCTGRDECVAAYYSVNFDGNCTIKNEEEDGYGFIG